VEDESAGGTAEPQSKVEHLKPLKSVQDIQEAWVADHAKHVGICRNLCKEVIVLNLYEHEPYTR
jgi:hypothetical protein